MTSATFFPTKGGRRDRARRTERALPANALGAFVRGLAQRIAQFPAVGMLPIKGRVGAITLAPIGSFRRAFDPFGEKARNPETLEFATILDDIPTYSQRKGGGRWLSLVSSW
jgi:hypothetical protein